MPTSFKYKGTSGFTSGNPKYDNPKDKEAPLWKILLLVLLTIIGAFAILVGGFLLLDYAFS
ncbi:MAG: hypothetical protein ACPGLV_04130 [Bacteroidia bacterium]